MSHEDQHPLTFHAPAGGRTNRRQALALMAASLALGATGCSRPRETILPWVNMPEARGGGLPLSYASAFVRDGHALGVLVATEDGRPIKIEGNPLHPTSLGATDVFAQASVLQLWDPDRSQGVVQRIGDGRSGPGSASTWSAFETAWQARATQLQARGGDGLRVLTGPLGSPTARAQLAALLQRFPRARWHQHAPLHDASAAAGAQQAFGRPVQPVLHLDRARCIVALASDPFSDGPGAVRHAADWARQRAATRDRGAIAPLFAAETSPGLFGARADHRIALAPAAIDAMLWRLAAALGGAPQRAPDEATARFEAELLAALRATGPDSLVVPGAALAPSSHALVHAVHRQLGASGRTIDLIAPLAMAPEAGTLAELVQAMDGGAVDTLLVLDANPVYDAPAALGFDQALRRVAFTLHAGLFRDETAQACAWHLPLSHDYEAWSDAVAHDGTACLVQPAIAPLYDTRSLHEVLALAIGDDVRDGHRLVQRQWRAHGGADFDAWWRRSLRRGVIDGTTASPLALGAPAMPSRPAAAAAPLVAVFAPDPSLHDGRYANNGWLQELPRPFTKLTWDNAVLLGAATARSLAVETGDMVRATVDGRALDAPVLVMPLHAEGAATLPLGFGRARAGRVGNGVGFDAYRLRPAGAVTAPLQLHKLGGTHQFAFTQHHMGQHDRDLARTVPPGGAIADAGFEHPTLYPAPASPEHAWAMSIDLDACIGCNACTIACQAENNIPVVGREEVERGRAMHWIRVDRYDAPEAEGGSIFQPVPCMHCEQAPCEVVCPVGATVHDSEGLNVQVYNRCVGTRFCSNNCPYKVRRFNFLQFSDETTESLKGQRNPNVTVRHRGVMEKCTYCLQRVARARQHAQVTGTPIADGDVVTACQAVCPTGAIAFGDLNDPASAVRGLRHSPRHYALLGELNTRPRTTYLARVGRPDGAT
jgi:Fe-S-cluster-containing dehydrogenase component/anaerobic selenocysteine-containing dehydrogenase